MELILPSDVRDHSVPPASLAPGYGQDSEDLLSARCDASVGCQQARIGSLGGLSPPPLSPSPPPCSTFGRISEKLHVETHVSALLRSSVIEA